MLLYFLGSSLIFGHSKCQDVVSLSSTEVKYRAMADIVLKLRWLRDFLSDIDVSVSIPIPMHCDNKSAIVIASNPIFHDHTNHIEVNSHITLQEYENGKTTPSYVSSGAQLGDLFTKAQTFQQFHEVLSKLSMFDQP